MSGLSLALIILGLEFSALHAARLRAENAAGAAALAVRRAACHGGWGSPAEQQAAAELWAGINGAVPGQTQLVVQPDGRLMVRTAVPLRGWLFEWLLSAGEPGWVHAVVAVDLCRSAGGTAQ